MSAIYTYVCIHMYIEEEGVENRKREESSAPLGLAEGSACKRCRRATA